VPRRSDNNIIESQQLAYEAHATAGHAGVAAVGALALSTAN
jgi:hypothetical protein